MNLNKMKKTYYILMYLPLLITLISLFFLPNTIPAHYGAKNKVTRWGSKYETLLFPIFSIFIGYFILLPYNFNSKKNTPEPNSKQNNLKISIYIGYVTLIIFNILTYFFLYVAFYKIEDLSKISFYKVICSALGTLFIVMGNLMPKIRMNSIFGIRTTWSMKNETIWKKCQYFGGLTFITIGIITLITNLLISGTKCFITTIISLLFGILVCILYSYFLSKKSKMH